MYRLTAKLIIYRKIDKDSILFHLSDICQRFASGHYDKAAISGDVLAEINRLLDVATHYGFDGNLWHNYLAFLLATTETPFTLVCEKHGDSEGSVRKFARTDLEVFRELLHYDFKPLEQALGLDCFSVIEDYQAVEKKEQIYNKSVSEKVQELSIAIGQAKDGDDMYRIVTDFYQRYGVGMFGLNKAFRVSPNIEVTGQLLESITTTGDMRLADLIGYENQKKRLQDNTEAFVAGRKANNVLLYGDAGTGKSTSIKAILNQYYDQGLRMIEVYKHEFKYLQRIIAQIKNRNYKFIIYMDDLSFEEFEIEYKYLKAVIEGGLEVKPDNVLIYATSNRRHLIKETWNDRNDLESNNGLHRSDTIEEKLSLVNRFGCQISYSKPSQKEFFDIVIGLARKNNVKMTDEELMAEANKWELSHGGISGRTAQQFINYCLGGRE